MGPFDNPEGWTKGEDGMNWAPGALSKARMIPMADVTWDKLLALPDDSEVVIIFILPLGIGMQLMVCDVNSQYREKLGELQRDGASLPQIAIYSLPPGIDVMPEPEAFIDAPKGH